MTNFDRTNVIQMGHRGVCTVVESDDKPKGPTAREFIRLSGLLHTFCADGIAVASPEWVALQLSETLAMIQAGQFPVK